MNIEANHNTSASYLFYVCLEEHSYEHFCGTIYPAGTEDIIAFKTFDDFIMKMDVYMDIHGPQSFQDKRSLTQEGTKSQFVLPTHSMERSPLFVCNSESTYHLYIFSRRNTEWQGALYLKDEEKLNFSNIIALTNFFANS